MSRRAYNAPVRHGPPRRWRALGPALCAVLVLAAVLAPASAAASGERDTSPVPIGEIAVRAEETHALLRRLESAATTPPDIAAIERQLPGAQDKIGRGLSYTDWLLQTRPSFPSLERLAEPWARMRRQLIDWNATLTRRATQVQDEMERLDALRQRWTATRDEARKGGTPLPVLERIDELIVTIGQSQQLVRAQRGVLVLLQDRVAAETGRCDQVLTRLEKLRGELVAGVLERGSPPIWSKEFYSGWWAVMGQGLGDALALLVRGTRYMALRKPELTMLYGLVLIALAALLWRTERNPVVRTALEGPAAPELPTGRALCRAIAGAWLVAALVMWLTDPTVGPVDAREVMLVLPVTLLLAPGLERRQRRIVYAFGILFVIDRLRNALWRQPVAEQGLLLLETLAAIALVVWFIVERRRGAAAATSAPRKWPSLDIAARALLAVWVAAFAAGAMGYLSLAGILTGGAVTSGYLALAFYGIVLVAERLAAVAIQSWPITRLQAVQRRPVVVLRKARVLLGRLGAALWVWATLDGQGLLESTVQAARVVLGARLEWGAIGISLGDVLAFGLTIWAAFMVSAVVRFFLEEDVFQHMGLKRGVPFALSRLLHYAILVLGLTVAITALGVDLNKITVLAGAFGIGIGFGLQNIVSNFVSGLILLMERPIHVGDAVQLGELTGEVRQIGMRSCIVRTWDGAEVIVPNTQLVSDKVVNWTLSDRMRRVTLKVGVAYGSDPERVIEILKDVATSHPRALKQPEPIAVLIRFGESSMDFELWVWTERFEDGVALQSDLGVAINAALSTAKIDVAVPQRVIHVRGGEGPTAPLA